MNLSQILNQSILQLSSGQEIGICADVLVDTSAGRVVCFLLLENAPGCRPLGLLSPAVVIRADDRLHANISSDDSRRLSQQLEKAAPEAPFDLTEMPAVVTGPFGHTVSPAMTGALLNARAGESSADERPDLDEKHDSWHWATRLIDIPVFSESEELGRVADIVLKSDTFDCVGLLVKQSDDTLEHLAMKHIRYVSQGEKSVIAQLSETPPWNVPEGRSLIPQ